MRKNSKNLGVKELLQTTEISNYQTKFNQFGNFVYKDHVTRKKYEVKKLKTSSHKTAKSVDNISTFYNFDQQFRQKKWQLTHFLQELVMQNQIKQKRNYIVSGNQKMQRRKSLLISLPKIRSNKSDLDQIKQKIRKEVDQINYQFLRSYLKKKLPYRGVLGQLSKISNTGALTSQKIKKIKKTINKCHRKDTLNQNHEANKKLIKIDEKENMEYERYFGQVWKNLDLQIKLKVKHQTAFNWKYGQNQEVQKIIKFCNQLASKKQKQEILE